MPKASDNREKTCGAGLYGVVRSTDWHTSCRPRITCSVLQVSQAQSFGMMQSATSEWPLPSSVCMTETRLTVHDAGQSRHALPQGAPPRPQKHGIQLLKFKIGRVPLPPSRFPALKPPQPQQIMTCDLKTCGVQENTPA